MIINSPEYICKITNNIYHIKCTTAVVVQDNNVCCDHRLTINILVNIVNLKYERAT
jgi:hypothetical protein